MLSKILGTIWIMLGTWWLIRPESLKKRLGRKMNRRVRWTVFSFVMVFAFLMIGSVIRLPGIPAKIIGIAGLVMGIKAIMLLTSKTSEKALVWWAERPVGFLRVWAGFMLVTGIMLIIV